MKNDTCGYSCAKKINKVFMVCERMFIFVKISQASLRDRATTPARRESPFGVAQGRRAAVVFRTTPLGISQIPFGKSPA
ncbi:MAG: hypothetical protein U1F40_05215 [Turneriella sp.]